MTTVEVTRITDPTFGTPPNTSCSTADSTISAVLDFWSYENDLYGEGNTAFTDGYKMTVSQTLTWTPVAASPVGICWRKQTDRVLMCHYATSDASVAADMDAGANTHVLQYIKDGLITTNPTSTVGTTMNTVKHFGMTVNPENNATADTVGALTLGKILSASWFQPKESADGTYSDIPRYQKNTLIDTWCFAGATAIAQSKTGIVLNGATTGSLALGLGAYFFLTM